MSQQEVKAEFVKDTEREDTDRVSRTLGKERSMSLEVSGLAYVPP